ncbi:hypothetical protein CEXT_180601 [Caerostris extrusa]|uniref:Uncharacterized protein n=1 Tax=Caerostris extrusa TaxID=172846 RepID=A0AAV4XGZ1_CAEEX|nr:hypothetical protein CEXT_180601 [Caerostris extrusa]
MNLLFLECFGDAFDSSKSTDWLSELAVALIDDNFAICRDGALYVRFRLSKIIYQRHGFKECAHFCCIKLLNEISVPHFIRFENNYAFLASNLESVLGRNFVQSEGKFGNLFKEEIDA